MKTAKIKSFTINSRYELTAFMAQIGWEQIETTGSSDTYKGTLTAAYDPANVVGFLAKDGLLKNAVSHRGTVCFYFN